MHPLDPETMHPLGLRIEALFILACAVPSWSRALFVMGQGLQAKQRLRLGSRSFLEPRN